MSRECRSEPKPHAGQSAQSGTASSASTSKSGFFVAAEAGDTQSGKSQFWLRQFVENKAKTQAVLRSESYKAEVVPFCGISTSPEHGVVDTAAEGGLVRSTSLEKIERKLANFGLKCKWIPKRSAAKGVGGQAKALGVVLLPLGLGGVNGLLETTVVEGDVPLLLPIRMMTVLRTVIDLHDMKFHMKEYSVTIPMFALPSGHVTVEIMNFANDRFQVPEGAPSCKQQDFEISHGEGTHVMECKISQQWWLRKVVKEIRTP